MDGLHSLVAVRDQLSPVPTQSRSHAVTRDDTFFQLVSHLRPFSSETSTHLNMRVHLFESVLLRVSGSACPACDRAYSVECIWGL